MSEGPVDAPNPPSSSQESTPRANTSSTMPDAVATSTSSSTLPSDAVCVSAPGKVLMAGGYLVLERKYEGLVLATSSRFYCVARSSKTPLPNTDERSARITISAAQFPAECSWAHTVTLISSTADTNGESSTETAASPAPAPVYLNLEQANPEVGRNKFVEIALAKTLQLALETIAAEEAWSGDMEGAGRELLKRIRGKSGGMEAFVMADNDFYSQREQLSERDLPRRMASLTQLPPFNPLPRPIHQINKTGLGSSAALTTSLTAALLSFLRIIDLPSESPSSAKHTFSLDTVHALAQLSHCLAQGKVGSGFDVSSAVFGSHAYRRFSPSILTPLMSAPHLPIVPSDLTSALARDRWDQTTTPLRLPRGLRLVLADVDHGTDTPSFVSKVLWWKVEEAEEATEIWKRLEKANGLLREHLEGMCKLEVEEGYDRFIRDSAGMHMEQLDKTDIFGKQLYRIYSVLFCLRQLFRLITAASKVPVEPEEQTRLLDACKKLPGVVGGGVPGAGGFDALFLLVIDTPSVLDAVEELWEGWEEMSVCPLLARQSDGGLVKVQIGEVKGLQEGIDAWGEKKVGSAEKVPPRVQES